MGDNCRMVAKAFNDVAFRRGIVSLAKSGDLQMGNPWKMRDLGVLLASVEPDLQDVSNQRLAAQLRRSRGYLETVGIKVDKQSQYPNSKMFWLWNFTVIDEIFNAQTSSAPSSTNILPMLGESAGSDVVNALLSLPDKLDAIYNQLESLKLI